MSDGKAYYATTDMLPPPNVRVRLLVSGYEIEVARVRCAKSGWRYVTKGADGNLRDVARDLARADRPAGGEYWAPLDASTWRLPLPAVALYVAPSDSPPGSRPEGAFDVASVVARSPQGGGVLKLYKDPLAIRYEPEGSVSRDMAEARVLRAILFDGVKANHCRRREGRAISWPKELAELSALLERMAAAEVDTITRRFEPVPADITDYLTAIGWFTRLNPPELWHKRREPWQFNDAQCVLVLRAPDPPFTWEMTGERCSRRSVGQVRRFYDQTIDAIHRIANGEQAYDHVTAADQIERLRARNARAKRRA